MAAILSIPDFYAWNKHERALAAALEGTDRTYAVPRVIGGVPVFNSNAYLKRCLEAYVAQTDRESIQPELIFCHTSLVKGLAVTLRDGRFPIYQFTPVITIRDLKKGYDKSGQREEDRLGFDLNILVPLDEADQFKPEAIREAIAIFDQAKTFQPGNLEDAAWLVSDQENFRRGDSSRGRLVTNMLYNAARAAALKVA